MKKFLLALLISIIMAVCLSPVFFLALSFFSIIVLIKNLHN